VIPLEGRSCLRILSISVVNKTQSEDTRK
jgi:hypothetical protein